MYKQELKVPIDRIAVLVGKNGEIKNNLEKKGQVKIDIDSKSGDVFISGEDSLKIYDTKIVIKAIARGFAPEVAFKLFNENYVFEIIDIRDYSGNSKKAQERLKGRVIGTEGKSRKNIEQMTDTKIVIYGKTVGIIGVSENVAIARRAIDSLLSGSPHGNVYKWIDKKVKELIKQKFEQEYGHKETIE